MLEVQGISHTYDRREVLRDINLSVETGEILAIMGSSGGGKTTLLKCIGGLLTPSKGDVLIEEVSIVKRPDQARHMVGLVFQFAALFDSLNVKDNVLFGLRRQKKLSKQQEDETVDYLLRTVALDPAIIGQMPSQLSGGMRKRVGLARTLAMAPKLLLYDEPTSGLDPVTAYSIDKMIVEMRRNLGLTSIVVSHDVASVFRVADRVAFLHGGELVFTGSPEEFRNSDKEAIRELVQKSQAEDFAFAE